MYGLEYFPYSLQNEDNENKSHGSFNTFPNYVKTFPYYMTNLDVSDPIPGIHHQCLYYGGSLELGSEVSGLII